MLTAVVLVLLFLVVWLIASAAGWCVGYAERALHEARAALRAVRLPHPENLDAWNGWNQAHAEMYAEQDKTPSASMGRAVRSLLGLRA